MKLIIAGSRTILMANSDGFIDGLLSVFIPKVEINELVSGGCPSGPDYWCKKYSEYTEIPLKEFPADWSTHGKAAGPIRNKQMAEYGDALLLIWDGESRGSASMLREMVVLNKPVYEVILKK